MLLNEIFDGMFDPRADRIVRELSNLFYKKWAPKLGNDDSKRQYSQMMDKYKDLAAQHKRGMNVEDKLASLRDIVKHAAKQPHTTVVLKPGRGTYD